MRGQRWLTYNRVFKGRRRDGDDYDDDEVSGDPSSPVTGQLLAP